MTNRYYCDDKERLVAFLYGETSDRERAEVEAHLAGCVTCAEEVDELRAVRVDLAAWQPPEAESRVSHRPRASDDEPAMVARAGVGAGGDGRRCAARPGGQRPGRVRQRRDRGAHGMGDDERTAGKCGCGAGRRRRHAGAQPAGQTASATMSEADVRAALASLESRLRAEMATARTASATPASAAGGAGFDRVALVKQVEGLIEASERRQQRELAFRLAQAMQDVDTQRRSDLVRIENGLGQIEGLTVQEGARQSRLINYLMRTSQER